MYLKILAHPVFTNLNFHMPMIVDLRSEEHTSELQSHSELVCRLLLEKKNLLLTLVTCRDGSGPQLYYARMAVAPVFPSKAGLASFGLSIDRVRFVVRHGLEVPDRLAD